jgi:membrane-bound ClpP family serine protease
MLLLLPLLSLALFRYLPAYAAAPLWLGIAAGCLWAHRAIQRSVRFPPQTGLESMAGATAVVVESLRPAGAIRYRGEVWRAAAAAPVEAGARVRILRVDRLPEGFTAIVEPVDARDISAGR